MASWWPRFGWLALVSCLDGTPALADLGDVLDRWPAAVAKGQSEQPSWATPLATNTARLEERFRYDTTFQHVGNGTDITTLDGGKGLDLMLGETEEIQIALPPYLFRDPPGAAKQIAGFNDWQFLRFKQRLASGNADNGDYIVSAFVAFQAPTGIKRLTNGAYQVSPTLAAGKGFGRFVVQGTVGATIPLEHDRTIGTQVITNVAFQLHVLRYLWPQIEINWTYYATGPRAGKSRAFLTPGLIISRLIIAPGRSITFGIGYQTAVAPAYRALPLLPTYQHAWLLSTRLNF